MKSFICEAQTVELAIRKAWENAGKPNTFFTKIIENGNESIFWWKKKNFKIAFFYELKGNIFEINNSQSKDFKKNEKFSNDKSFQKKDLEKKENFIEKKFENQKDFNNTFKKKEYINKEYINKTPLNKENKFEEKNNTFSSFKNNEKKEVIYNNQENLKEKTFDKKREPSFSKNFENKSLWNDRQLKFLKTFALNFYSNFFEKKSFVNFTLEEDNICKINFGKAPLENEEKNKDLSLSISTLFSEVLYSKFRDFNIKNCKIIIIFE